jgi:hypothetical protein
MAAARRNSSPYYPPRARWYSPVLGAFDRLHRSLALDRLNLALGSGVNLAELVAGFLVPGLAFYFRASGIIGKAALVWAGLLVLMFFILLGEGWDTIIFGLLLSVHVSGFVFYCTPLLGSSVWGRLAFTLGMLAAIRLLVYFPAQSFLETYGVTPLQWNGRVLIVSHIYSTKSIREGEWLAYTISGQGYEGGVYIDSGLDFAQVLALPGDRILFSEHTYSVNGVPHPSLPHMPETGSLVVPQKEWFVWPNLAIRERLNRESGLSEMLMRMALLREDRLIGTPLQRWFWRRQNLS